MSNNGNEAGCRKNQECNKECPSNCSCKQCNKKCLSDCQKECCKPEVPKCKPGCILNCCIRKCKEYTAEEIACKFKDAVVQVHGQFVLLGGYPGEGIVDGITGATGGTALEANIRTDVTLEGNGFFIKGHYIIVPSQTILMPPSLTSTANRFPFVNDADILLGRIRNRMIRASRILVSVFNVNGRGHSFVYEADLIGVEGAGNLAVLKIDHSRAWNQGNPCIERCHPYLKFGESRRVQPGEKVYLIGDYVSSSMNPRMFNAAGAISEGIVSDHRYADYSGWNLAENVLVSANAYAESSGLPIINGQGRVIGMQTTDVIGRLNMLAGLPNMMAHQGDGLVGGPSEFYMRDIIKTLIKGQCNRQQNPSLQLITDSVGNYYRYRKAYAGIAYDILTGPMYSTTNDYTSGSDTSGFSRININSDGTLSDPPSCKELIGIRVLGLAGANPSDEVDVANGAYYVPGGTGTDFLPEQLPNSPFMGKVNPGDIITHINTNPLGDLGKQVPPMLFTSRLPPGATVEFTYRRGGNLVNVPSAVTNDNYENIFSNFVKLIEFPLLMDYPWYAVNVFPSLAVAPYPGFIFPQEQTIAPQLPSRALDVIPPAEPVGYSRFHPAF